jgi:hypothetical protein
MATISIRLTTLPPYMVIEQPGTSSGLFTETELKVLELVARGVTQTLDRVISRIEGNALGGIRHLIFEGYLELIGVAHPWGLEYELRLTESGRAKLSQAMKGAPVVAIRATQTLVRS